jgi:hypothetical protein
MHQQKLKNSSLSIGDILQITIDIFKSKWDTLLIILIGINFPLLLVEQLTPKGLIHFSFWIIINIIVITLEWLAIVLITEKTILDENITSKLAIKRGFDKLKTQLFNLLVMWIIYIISIIVGFILFIIPGFYMGITHFFFSEAIALRNATFFQSFQYSRNLVEGNFCKVFILSSLTSATFSLPNDFLPISPTLGTILMIIFQLFFTFIYYIMRIIVTVSFLNLDYVKNGLPNRA